MTELIVGLIRVVVGAVVTGLKDLISTSFKTRKRARYLALITSTELERFFTGCIDVVNDDGTSYGQPMDGDIYRPRIDVPKLDWKEFDVDWLSINRFTMARLLLLPNKADDANRAIWIQDEYGDGPPEYNSLFEERQFRYAEIAIETHKLIKLLRTQYSLPDEGFPEHWNPIEICENTISEIEKIRTDRFGNQKTLIEGYNKRHKKN